MTSFIEAIINFLSSLFGKKETTAQTTTTTEEQEPVKVNTNEYVIPSGVNNMLTLMQTQCELTEDEMTELRNQITTMGSLGHTHYVIHTTGRADTYIVKGNIVGNRYWELNYLTKAKVMDVISSTVGYSRDEMVAKGLEPLFFENLLS